MGKAITVRGKLADPRHVELEEPVTDLAGRLEVVLRPVPADSSEQAAPASDPLAIARALQASAPRQRSDSVELLRQDRLR
jgi:hypothetical protein